MTVKVFKGKKELKLGTDEIPELDNEQLRAGDDMANLGRYMLFSDPGAGKTLTALHAMAAVWDLYDANARSLILCPSIAVRTWARWIKATCECVGRSAVVQIIASGKDVLRPDATHVILTYGLTSPRKINPVVSACKAAAFEIFIADESDNLVGWSSNRTRCVYGPMMKGDGLVEPSRWRWFLTGTPIPRYNDGLYPVLRANFPDRLASFGALTQKNFKAEFCVTRRVKFGHMRHPVEQINGSRNNSVLKELLFGATPRICTRVKLKLGEFIERQVDIDVKFSKEFLALEDELSEGVKFQDEAALMDPRFSKAMALMGLESAKAVADYVIDCTMDQRNSGVTLGKVVLAWHTDVIDALVTEFDNVGLRVSVIDGRTKQEDDAETECKFNNGDLDIVVGQIKAMGVAINLQENCDHVIFAEETFSHAMNLQALQRVWRRGQENQVTVDYCRPYSALAEMRPRTVLNKKGAAEKVLD